MSREDECQDSEFAEVPHFHIRAHYLYFDVAVILYQLALQTDLNRLCNRHLQTFYKTKIEQIASKIEMSYFSSNMNKLLHLLSIFKKCKTRLFIF